MKNIAFFNNKGGVGKTSLVYHLSWMYAELGLNVIAVDLDPQANLTTMFLDEERLETVWDEKAPLSILGCVSPILRGLGDIQQTHIESISEKLNLIIGDLGLARFEDKLSDAWPRCMNNDESSFRITTAFYRIIFDAVRRCNAHIVLIDVGPNLGAINRAAVIAADYLVVPLVPDLFSLQGMKNLGPTLKEWQEGWTKRLDEYKNQHPLELPKGTMQPIGYIVMQHAIRTARPVKAYERWMERIPKVFRKEMLQQDVPCDVQIQDDPYCLSSLKHYRSLAPMAQEARKPMFLLKPADGALGAHLAAVHDCYKDFEQLARRIAQQCDISIR